MFLNHLVVKQIRFDWKHTSVSSQYMLTLRDKSVSYVQAGDLIIVPGHRVDQACIIYIRTVKARSRPQDTIEGPLLLGSLALLGAG